jgi:hypothetical protein
MVRVDTSFARCDIETLSVKLYRQMQLLFVAIRSVREIVHKK